MGCQALFDGTLRIVLFGLNFSTLMAGGVLLGCGIYVKISIDTFTDIGDIEIIDVTAYLLIALGLLVILLSLVGCLGACLQNHVLLGCYFVLMLLLLLSEIGIGILYAVEKGEIESRIESAVKKTVENYGDGTNPSADTAVDVIQDLLQCCGYDKFTDYVGTTYSLDNLPASCCEGEPTLCKSSKAYEKGCKTRISDFLESQSVLVIIIVSAVALLEIITMLMACYLRKRELADIDYIIDNPPYSM